MFKAGAGFHSGFMPLSINIIKNYTNEKTLTTSQALNLLKQRGYLIKDDPLPAS